MVEQHEATLDDLLSEPIILTVMARDGVRGADIRRLLRRVQAREQQGLLTPMRDLGQPRPNAI